jgi:hypothetical protein
MPTIYRIEFDWPLPEAFGESDDDDRHKYVKGPLAYAVNRDDEDEDEDGEQETDRQD